MEDSFEDFQENEVKDTTVDKNQLIISILKDIQNDLNLKNKDLVEIKKLNFNLKSVKYNDTY